MKRWTTSLALFSTLAIGASGLTYQVQAEDGNAAEAPAEAKATVTGQFVAPKKLPANVKAEDLDMSKLTGTITWEVPPVPVPYPEGFEQMSDDEKRAWAQKFRQTPEFQEYINKARARMMEQRQQRPMPIEITKDGGFSIEGLKPGKYILRASIPHPKSQRQKLAEYGKAIEVKAGQAAVELANLELNVNSVLVPGDVAPDFTAQTYDGGSFKLSDYRGKYVLIDFWATWCGPCIAELPNLKAVYKDYAGDKFEMIGLSLDQNIDLPKKFAEKNPSDYVHGYLGAWSDSEVPKQYGVRGIPSIWLIGPDGKIVARDLRGQRLREAVKQAVEGGDDAS